MQWRCRCHVAACGKYFQAGTSRGRRPPNANVHLSCAKVNTSSGDAVASRRYSNYRGSSTFPLLNPKGCYHRRTFSKFSPEEVVIQHPDPPPATSSAPENKYPAQSSIAAANPRSSISSSETPQLAQPQKILADDNDDQVARKNSNSKLLIELHEAHELFQQICTEAKALLRNNENSTTSEEVVAMTDYFMVLVNSLDLEKSLETIQSLQQTALHAKQEGKREEHDKLCEGGRKEVMKEKLRQAIKSMSQLHHVFLTMVESALPLSPPILPKEADTHSEEDGNVDYVPSFDKELHSPLTVGRALQLSRRAVELGMPMHRPLYQRLATGVVLASSPAISLIPKPSFPVPGDAAEFKSTEHAGTEPVTLILPDQFQQIKEGLHAPPLALELLGIYQHACSALKISSGDQLHQLAMELLADPFLLLLKQRRWEEAMGLLRGWRSQLGNGEKIDLLGLLGESNTLDALEITKGWLQGGTDFGEEAQSNPHVMELTNLLEVSVAEILKGHKEREEKLSHLLWQLSLHNNDEGDFDDESDSDSDFEGDFDYGSDGEEEFETPMATPTPADFSTVTDSTPSNSPVVRAKSDPQGDVMWNDEKKITLSFHADDATAPTTPANDPGTAAEESTIIKGMSDKEARKCIYLRNGVDWVLPDIVPTLEDWNKGNQLSFTPEFERYLGQQIMKEGKEEDEDQ